MAPLRTLPGPAARPSKSILRKPDTTSSPSLLSSAQPDSLFTTTKKDKRRIKHAQLMSKVTKATAKPRRRRPNKKLVTTLEGLADALPDDGDAGDEGMMAGQANVIRRRSLKSRPGALKRRERVDKSERERFARNMAQMAGKKDMDGVGRVGGVTTPDSAASGTAKWAALRGFISQTLEQRPDIKITS